MFRFAIGNLRSRPVRSALSILGLTVAIAGMVGLFSIAGGIQSLVVSTFDQIPGILVQQRGAPFPLFSNMPSSWKQEIEKVPGVKVVNAEVMGRANIIDGKNIISPPRFLIGFDVESRLKLKKDVFREGLKKGRFLERSDRGTNRCVVSRQISDEFHKGIGDALEVNGENVLIVGIYECGSLLLDVNILCDIGTCRSIARIPPENVCSYYVEQDGTVPDKVLTKSIEGLFVGRGHSHWTPSMLGGSQTNPFQDLFRSIDLWVRTGGRGGEPVSSRSDHSGSSKGASPAAPKGAPETASAVEVRSANDWADRFNEFSGDLNLFLAIMTTIGLVIASLSIVNTMLMSVTERTIEFGVLRANGWTQNDILKLVTLESALLGGCGGVLGSIFGVIATQVLNSIWPDRLHLHAGPGLVVLGLGCSVLLGILGGAYPAWYAARMSPMAAIRRAA